MKYSGSCHCGAVQFSVELELKEVLSCNCSICTKRGSLLAFAPESAVQVEKGLEMLTDYQFGPKTIHHLFCRACGILPFGKAEAPGKGPMRAINVRCLDGVDFEALPVVKFDGRNL
jgi:hypothetical protein